MATLTRLVDAVRPTKPQAPARVVEALSARYSADTIERIDQLATLVTVAAGTELIVEGRIGAEAFVIISGNADVTRNGEHVAEVNSGDVIGELALISGARRNATVTALTDVEVYAFSIREFTTLIDERPDVSRRLLTDAPGRVAASAA